MENETMILDGWKDFSVAWHFVDRYQIGEHTWDMTVEKTMRDEEAYLQVAVDVDTQADIAERVEVVAVLKHPEYSTKDIAKLLTTNREMASGTCFYDDRFLLWEDVIDGYSHDDGSVRVEFHVRVSQAPMPRTFSFFHVDAEIEPIREMLSDMNVEYEQQLAKINQRITTVETTDENLRKELTTLRLKNVELGAEVATLKKTKRVAEQRIDELETTIAVLNEKLETEVSSLRAQLATLNRTLTGTPKK